MKARASWRLGIYVQAFIDPEDQGSRVFWNVGSVDSRPDSSAALLREPGKSFGTSSLIYPEDYTWTRRVPAYKTSYGVSLRYIQGVFYFMLVFKERSPEAKDILKYHLNIGNGTAGIWISRLIYS